MGIKFKCEHCHRTLNIKEHLAGMRGICPRCQGKIEIPLASTNSSMETPTDATASVMVRTARQEEAGPNAQTGPQEQTGADAVAGLDPIAEAPDLNWYVAPSGSMTKYGPAPGELMRSWLREGRVSGDSLVWREGWPQWRTASHAFPDLTAARVESAQPDEASEFSPASSLGQRDGINASFGKESGSGHASRAPDGVDRDEADPFSPDILEGAPEIVARGEAATTTRDDDAGFEAIAVMDYEPTSAGPSTRSATIVSGRKPAANQAAIIAVLFVAVAGLISVLVYLLAFRLH